MWFPLVYHLKNLKWFEDYETLVWPVKTYASLFLALWPVLNYTVNMNLAKTHNSKLILKSLFVILPYLTWNVNNFS